MVSAVLVGRQDRKGHRASLELPVERKVYPVQQDRKVSRVIQEKQGQGGHVDRRDRRVILVTLVLRALLDREAHADGEVHKARKVTRVIPELPELQDREGDVDDAGQQDHKVSKVCPERREYPVHRLDRMVARRAARFSFSNYGSIRTVA